MIYCLLLLILNGRDKENKVSKMTNNILALISSIGFSPKNNTLSIYQKIYTDQNNYVIELNLEKNTINFGDKISFNESNQNTQNITKDEDLVVLECVDRLISKDYKPQNIILEKVYPSGYGHSGRLDILVVNDDDKTSYMMIECKTWGKEFSKEFNNLKKDGGQLFTYFQQDKNVDILVLYTSNLIDDKIVYSNQIIKIADEYKATSNVQDFYDRWNKISKDNGIFENYTNAYEFISKALTKKNLKPLRQEDSSKIFNRFLEILRHNVVSDKPNAFNKIFTLFLCKIIDEDRIDDEELHFQWLDGIDDDISFQKRLTDLYNRGMNELLDKQVTDVSDSEFDKQFKIIESEYKGKFDEFKNILTEIRLKKNNEFAIKEVFDDDSFNENAIVVKEIVELLQTYQIRYTHRQQFLSDFFEQLLTTGLKQESGQFFTPVPIARFIIKSMPFNKIIQDKIDNGKTEKTNLLPTIIDYSAGSGHFITESMEEVQKYIDTIDETKYKLTTKNSIINWKNSKYDWAENYVYAIEKDYRLVKTAKVSCYLHGDGLAKVIHGDGLADFETAKEYKDKLKTVDRIYPQDNKQFDIIVSNPPYSVNSFKSMMDSKKSAKNFELYDILTDQSSEIEALFIERTKQLLKDDGIAGIILPSSILSSGGIYIKTREIIFKYFDIVSIVELGSNTFMATGTNTVILFLRRKNNADHQNIKASVDKLYELKKDIAIKVATMKVVENPLAKYINHVWEDINLSDYFTLLENKPNETIKNHELYLEYNKKLNNIDKIIELEKEKLFYFVMAYTQKITLVKTGEKKEEKRFLGYKFSNRRGSEGIHPTQRDKSIDECTSLYDEFSYENNLKANSYIYNAFNGIYKDIDKSLKDNISHINLVDMMSFDRVHFDKNISLNLKRISIESKWKLVTLGENISFRPKSKRQASYGLSSGKYPFYTSSNILNKFCNTIDYLEESIIIGDGGKSSIFIDKEFSASAHNFIFYSKNSKLLNKFIFNFFSINFSHIEMGLKGQSLKNISKDYLQNLKLPLPTKRNTRKNCERD